MEEKVKDIIDYIKSEMKVYSMVHYVDTKVDCVRFRCDYCSVNCMGIQNVLEKFRLVDVYISDGLLCFDYTEYLYK